MNGSGGTTTTAAAADYEERRIREAHAKRGAAARMEGGDAPPPPPLLLPSTTAAGNNGLPALAAYMGLTTTAAQQPQAHHHRHHHPQPPPPPSHHPHSPHSHHHPRGAPYYHHHHLASPSPDATHNGHQIPYQPYAGSYNAHYQGAEVAFGGYGELGGYGPRGLGYAPAPAHQAYPPQFAPPPPQQQQMLHAGSPYDQQQQHLQHAHKPTAWQPHPIMQPMQSMEADPSALGHMPEDPPKIKIKTDIFKEESDRGGPDAPAADTPNPDCDLSTARPPGDGGVPEANKADVPYPIPGHNNDMNPPGINANPMDPEAAQARISDGGNGPDGAPKKFPGFSESESPSSSEDEAKIPNDIYFGTPDMSTYRPKMPLNASAPGMKSNAMTPGLGEVKKRGRPKGSVNKPKPPGSLPATPRPQGRPRGGGHSTPFMPHAAIRPFKRDFSGIRFKRRFSDDGLDSSHIPNEVYFGDVPVSTEVLFNYHDVNAGRDGAHGHHKVGHKRKKKSRNAYSSSSSSSSDDSDDSDDDSTSDDSSDTENEPYMDSSSSSGMKRGPGRPRGSKTINRRSEGPRLPSESNSPGDKPPGITEMKRFVKIAGIEYDYAKLVEGCVSNKERVAALMGLLEQKGLQGPPTVEACRALYTGPPPRRRGPKPGTKRTPKTSAASPGSNPGSPKSPKTPNVSISTDEDSRRVTRGQTSGKPRQRIVISSDEEDSHTPLSKLRTMR